MQEIRIQAHTLNNTPRSLEPNFALFEQLRYTLKRITGPARSVEDLPPAIPNLLGAAFYTAFCRGRENSPHTKLPLAVRCGARTVLALLKTAKILSKRLNLPFAIRPCYALIFSSFRRPCQGRKTSEPYDKKL